MVHVLGLAPQYGDIEQLSNLQEMGFILNCSFIGIFPSKGNGGSTLREGWVLERRLL